MKHCGFQAGHWWREGTVTPGKRPHDDLENSEEIRHKDTRPRDVSDLRLTEWPVRAQTNKGNYEFQLQWALGVRTEIRIQSSGLFPGQLISESNLVSCSYLVSCSTEVSVTSIVRRELWDGLWLRICLPIQGTRVWSRSGKIPQATEQGSSSTQLPSRCSRARNCSCWAHTPQPLLCNKRSHCSEKPTLRNHRAVPILGSERKSACSYEDPCSKHKQIKL